jgi:hypothetical protein
VENGLIESLPLFLQAVLSKNPIRLGKSLKFAVSAVKVAWP